MITNKKGLSDIVTTALIILLVAVAVAAIWAFVAPALRGTGTQFTKTQVCVSNIIEPITCTTAAVAGNNPGGTDGSGIFPFDVQIRLTLTDGVAVPTEFDTVVGTSGATQKVTTTSTSTTATSPAVVATNSPGDTTGAKVTIPKTQGELKQLIISHTTSSTSAGKSPQVQVTTTYRMPDNTYVKCPSLPISCNLP